MLKNDVYFIQRTFGSSILFIFLKKGLEAGVDIPLYAVSDKQGLQRGIGAFALIRALQTDDSIHLLPFPLIRVEGEVEGRKSTFKVVLILHSCVLASCLLCTGHANEATRPAGGSCAEHRWAAQQAGVRQDTDEGKVQLVRRPSMPWPPACFHYNRCNEITLLCFG